MLRRGSLRLFRERRNPVEADVRQHRERGACGKTGEENVAGIVERPGEEVRLEVGIPSTYRTAATSTARHDNPHADRECCIGAGAWSVILRRFIHVNSAAKKKSPGDRMAPRGGR